MTDDCDTPLHQGPTGPWWKGARGEWFLVVQALLFGLVALGPASHPLVPAWPSSVAAALKWPGVALMAAGGVLAVAGVVKLGDSLTALPYPKDCSRLETDWPYSVVRHPIYSGLVIGSLGVALWRGGWLPVLYALLLFAFFDVKSRLEERWLAQKYADYLAYRAQVRKLIPWVY